LGSLTSRINGGSMFYQEDVIYLLQNKYFGFILL